MNEIERQEYYNKNHLDKKERYAYYAAAFLRAMLGGVMGGITYFYVDVLGLSGLALSVLMIVKQIWDGVNDPLVGVWFDRSAKPYEKAIPVFKKTAIPIAVLLVAMMWAPTFSSDPTINMWCRFAFALAVSIPYELFLTANNIANSSMINAVTPNYNEKTNIIAKTSMMSTVGGFIAGGALPILYSLVDPTDIVAKTTIYICLTLFGSVAFLISNFLMVRYVKERVLSVQKIKSNKDAYKNMVKAFITNKPLMIIMISSAIGGIINPGATAIWFYQYCLGNAALSTYVPIVGIPTFLLASIYGPKLVAKFERRTMVLILAAISFGLNGLYLILGYNSLLVVFGISFLWAFPGTLGGIVRTSMISDTLDYAEWKTGERNDGVIYSMLGVLDKIVGSFGAGWTAIIIAWIKFVPNAPTQSPETLRGIFVVPIVITMVSCLLSNLPFVFYKFSKAQHRKILEELRVRREAMLDEQASK